MSQNRKIAADVMDFLHKAAALHAKSEAEKFQQAMFGDLIESGIESPIEDLFWIACNAQCAAQCFEVNPSPLIDENLVPSDDFGVYITPQARIGKYRVDFLLRQVGVGPSDTCTPVVVELDGHAFHDKNKTQRSYEKARDRFLVRNGFRVLHFTGSDVVADPFRVAHEALDLLGVFDGVDTRYDAIQPLGVEL
jgi:very-short-patch-repair endonuclease